MSVSIFFGLPGAGKTSLIAQKAYKNLDRYEHIYCNTDLRIDGVVKIDFECIGKYLLRDCLILIDEATLYADSRDYKVFDGKTKQYFILHRHYKADIMLFTQYYNGVDLRIRRLSDRLYRVYKKGIGGLWITQYYRIPYDIIIPDGKKTSGEKLGEIIEGYCKPPLLVRLFHPRIWRPKYYKYFDSFECPSLPALPERYKAYRTPGDEAVRAYLQIPAVRVGLLCITLCGNVCARFSANVPASEAGRQCPA